jgi:hypothetical protein
MYNLIDEKIREAVWNSKIPIKIDISYSDISDIQRPPSQYVIYCLIL